MRIALVHNLPSGGALRQARALASQLSRRHDVALFSLSTADAGPMGAAPSLSSATEPSLSPASMAPSARQLAPPLSLAADAAPHLHVPPSPADDSADSGEDPADRSHRVLHCEVHPFQPWPPLGRPLGVLNPVRRMMDLRRLDVAFGRMAASIDRQDFDVVAALPCRFTQAPLVLRYLRTPSAYLYLEPPRTIHERHLRPIGEGAPRRGWRDVRDGLLHLALRRHLEALDRITLGSATAVLAASCFARETATRIYGCWPWTVRWCGVDAKLFDPSPSEADAGHLSRIGLRSLEREGYYLSVGALHWLKGHRLILEALGRLPETLRRPLVIVFDREAAGERAVLDRLGRDAGIPILFRERIEDSELAGLYRNAALTLVAPILEPLGLVPLESMACGTPVVGVAEGGVRETIAHGVTGLLVERDSGAYAEAVAALAGDAALRRRMGAAGVLAVRDDWTHAAAAGRLIQALERVIDGRRSACA